MKITICGSSAFRKQMIEYKRKLLDMGHEPIVHQVYEDFAAGEKQDLLERIKHEHAAVKREYGFIKWYYNAIVESDVILVLNLEKNGVHNYVGGNTLMEMGFAHAHDKKIFLLNPAPDLSYKAEIEAMMTKVLDGDLTRIF